MPEVKKYRPNIGAPRPPPHEEPAAERAGDFRPVDTGVTKDDAIAEANRCLAGQKPRCMPGCPVGGSRPGVSSPIRDADWAGALETIKGDNLLPSGLHQGRRHRRGQPLPRLQEAPVHAGLPRRREHPRLHLQDLTKEDAIAEANRCLDCKKPLCMQGCPVGVNIPGFISKIRDEDWAGALETIKGDNLLPSGCGPSGCGRAGELAREGFDVTVFEAFFTGGGVLTYGIPEFRLPKKIVKREIDGLEQLGVKFEYNSVAGRLFDADELFSEDGFGEDGFVSAVQLERMELGEPDASGRRRPVPVADSAFEIPCDVAITAIGTMANPFAKLCADVELNRWGLIDGRRRPVPVADSAFEIPCDVAITAIGTMANPFAKLCADVELNRWGLIEADEDGRTSNPKVWAGGDIVTGAATVILAMGAGKKAAASMKKALLGE